jgi:hypothetical protein
MATIDEPVAHISDDGADLKVTATAVHPRIEAGAWFVDRLLVFDAFNVLKAELAGAPRRVDPTATTETRVSIEPPVIPLDSLWTRPIQVKIEVHPTPPTSAQTSVSLQ